MENLGFPPRFCLYQISTLLIPFPLLTLPFQRHRQQGKRMQTSQFARHINLPFAGLAFGQRIHLLARVVPYFRCTHRNLLLV